MALHCDPLQPNELRTLFHSTAWILSSLSGRSVQREGLESSSNFFFLNFQKNIPVFLCRNDIQNGGRDSTVLLLLLEVTAQVLPWLCIPDVM